MADRTRCSTRCGTIPSKTLSSRMSNQSPGLARLKLTNIAGVKSRNPLDSRSFRALFSPPRRYRLLRIDFLLLATNLLCISSAQAPSPAGQNINPTKDKPHPTQQSKPTAEE